MSGRTGYNAEEWRLVGGLPMYAAAFVVASAPHHAVGTIKDMLTAGRKFLAIAAENHGNSLLADVAADGTGPNGDPGPTKHDEENIARLRTAVTDAARLIDEKDPGDGPEFKAFVYQTAQSAAEASRDGVFGSHGDAVNTDEAAALAALASILQVEP